jgi:uncharacterized protein
MLLLLSPAKSLDFETRAPALNFTQPAFLQEAESLNQTLRTLSPESLASLMDISDKLGELNFRRNLDWHIPFTADNAKPAIFAFTGDVYTGLNVASWSPADLSYAQDHVRILSGLYGLLRPLDLIQPYRLEMGTSLRHGNHHSLYEFWGSTLADALRTTIPQNNNRTFINLASVEYYRAVKHGLHEEMVISPVFKDFKNGQYKIISFFAKKARGQMASWIIQNRITDSAGLLDFDLGGYRYSKQESTESTPVYLRKQA